MRKQPSIIHSHILSILLNCVCLFLFKAPTCWPEWGWGPNKLNGPFKQTKNLSKHQGSSRYFLLPKFSTQTEHFPFRTYRPLECAIQKLLFIVWYDYPEKKKINNIENVIVPIAKSLQIF